MCHNKAVFSKVKHLWACVNVCQLSIGMCECLVNQYCAHSFTRNWQLPFLNQRKGENDRRKYFIINLYKKMLPTRWGHSFVDNIYLCGEIKIFSGYPLLSEAMIHQAYHTLFLTSYHNHKKDLKWLSEKSSAVYIRHYIILITIRTWSNHQKNPVLSKNYISQS